MPNANLLATLHNTQMLLEAEQQRRQALEAEVNRLRAALMAVEWLDNETGDSDFCPWCGSYEKCGHHPDCQRKLALGYLP